MPWLNLNRKFWKGHYLPPNYAKITISFLTVQPSLLADMTLLHNARTARIALEGFLGGALSRHMAWVGLQGSAIGLLVRHTELVLSSQFWPSPVIPEQVWTGEFGDSVSTGLKKLITRYHDNKDSFNNQATLSVKIHRDWLSHDG